MSRSALERHLTSGAVSAICLCHFVSATAACGPTLAYFAPPPTTTTLMLGWEHWFSLDWTATPENDGSRRIEGYLTSRNPGSAEPIRLLARAVDSHGQAVGQRIAWIPGGVNGFGRVFFLISGLPDADHYIVTVWDYTILQGAGDDKR
jgi:hypothetical protein